ncbi:MAG: CapA family protein [Chloroflexi bacterium]|nr:CapA family protein [Chloroflexota bacterium]
MKKLNPGMRGLRLVLLIAVFVISACTPQTSTLAPIQPSKTLSPPTGTHTLTPTNTLTQTSTTAPTLTTTATELPNITLLFTGVIVPARCVQAGIDEAGDYDYPYQNVREIISEADIAIGTLNTTISDFTEHTGCVSTYLLVSGEENADAMARAGFDIMSVATNHIKDCGVNRCGDRAFFDTLDNLRRVGILPVGAGENLQAALQPVVVNVMGVRFGIVSLGMVNTTVFATEDSPGIAVLDEDNLIEAIAAARLVSDVVIAMPHWGAETNSVPTFIQIDFAQRAVEAGANLVVGNHTHVVQAIGEIDNIPIFYGLGNFIFDQVWSAETSQGVILQVYFRGTEYTGYELIPTSVEGNGTVHIAEGAEAESILARIQQASEQCPGDC